MGWSSNSAEGGNSGNCRFIESSTGGRMTGRGNDQWLLGVAREMLPCNEINRQTPTQEYYSKSCAAFHHGPVAIIQRFGRYESEMPYGSHKFCVRQITRVIADQTESHWGQSPEPSQCQSRQRRRGQERYKRRFAHSLVNLRAPGEIMQCVNRVRAAERSNHRREAVGCLSEGWKGPPCPVNCPRALDLAGIARRQVEDVREIAVPRSVNRLSVAKRAQSAPLKVVFSRFPSSHIGPGQSDVQLTGHSTRPSSAVGAIEGLIVVNLNSEGRD